jgi:aminopeptidase N
VDGFAMAGQPDMAHMVFPCNDHPSDKARFLIRVTVPDGQGLIGVANGTLDGTVTENGRTTYSYSSRDPMATELVQVVVGKYTVVNRQGPAGVPVRDVVPTDRLAKLEPALALTPGQLEWVTQRLGAFPLETYGLLPVNNDRGDAFDFTGLETQTLTLYKPKYLEQEERRIGSHQMHELTHSWFGNSVSPATWADLWLNEGHADLYGLEYRYERGWTDTLGFTTLEARMRHTYSLGDRWRAEGGPVARPNAANLFHSQRYLGGVLVLFALREKVGAETFRSIERTFLERHRNGVASTEAYIGLASEISGQDLGPFLRTWLYGSATPPMPGHPDWTVTPVPATPPPAARSTTPVPSRDNSATL